MYVHLQNVTLIYLVHDSVTTCTRSKAGGIPSYKFKWQWSLTAYIYKHHSTVKQAIWKLKWPPPWQGTVYRAHAFNLNISQHI